MSVTRLPARAMNAIRHRLRTAYWQRSTNAPGLECLHQRAGRPFLQAPVDGLPTSVSASFAQAANLQQDEYIHRFRGPVVIEAHTGFAIFSGRRLLTPSLPYAYQAGPPPILRSTDPIRLDRAISLRDVHESNYYHFYNDVLAKVPLLRAHGLSDAPLIVGKALGAQPFFRELLPALRRNGLEIVEQGDRDVIARELVYCKSMPLDRSLLLGVLRLVDAPVIPEGDGRKVFLTRARGMKGGRWLTNGDEVEAVMRALGFEVIDAGRLPVMEQMRLCAGARQLVGLHGAALTNMLFRQHEPLHVLEIFPEGYTPPHYSWLAATFGHDHNALTGSALSPDGSFTVAKADLERAVARAELRA